LIKCISAVLLLMFAFTVNAQLFERGLDEDGNHTMVYDDVTDLTWLADANYANTSNYEIPDSGFKGGLFTWGEARQWADTLSYGGFSDWRLPSAYGGSLADPDTTESGPTDSSGPTNVYGSELANMSVLVNSMVTGVGDPNITSGLFSNIKNTMYWSSTSTSSERAWMTTFAAGGGVGALAVGNNYVYEMRDDMFSTYAWAVRSGDVAAVPLPAASWLFGPALAWLFSITGARRRLV